MNNLAIGTVIGWVIGNLTALYLSPSSKIRILKEGLENLLRDPLRSEDLERQKRYNLKKQLFSIQFIFISIMNLAALVLIPLVAVLGPCQVLGWLIADARNWTLSVADRCVFWFVFLVQLVLFIQKGGSPWIEGYRVLRK